MSTSRGIWRRALRLNEKKFCPPVVNDGGIFILVNFQGDKIVLSVRIIKEEFLNMAVLFESLESRLERAAKFREYVQEGNIQKVIDIIRSRYDIDYGIGLGLDNGMTPLIYAAGYDNVEIVNAIIEAEADVNARDWNGNTALMRAAMNGYTEIVNALLQAGADVHAKNNSGYTALMLAQRNDDTETIIALQNPKYVEKNNSSSTSVKNKWSYKIVRTLLNRRTNINARDDNGNTALIWAASKGDAETVNALLNAGANVNARTKTAEPRLCRQQYIDIQKS